MEIPPAHSRRHATTGLLLAGTALTVVVLTDGPWRAGVGLSNLALLCVLGVVVIAVNFGRLAAIAAALIGSFAFAYVFVPPHFSLAITETEYVLTAAVMLAVALLVSHLTSRLKQQAEQAERKSVERSQLCELAQKLAGALTRAEISQRAGEFLARTFNAQAVRIALAGEDAERDDGDRIRLCLRQHALFTRPLGDGHLVAYVPLHAASGAVGALIFHVEATALASPQGVEYLEAGASIMAVALERSLFLEKANQTEIRHAAESLRSSILSALSHDLRTPLTALVGMTETVARGMVSAAQQRELLDAIGEQARSISRQMTNLLDMARLSSGPTPLRRDWQPVEEVLGATLGQAERQWPERTLAVTVAPDLPPLNLDAVLLERALWNLIENAIKYSPAEAPVEVAVQRADDAVEIAVCDRGAGLPEAHIDALFERFQRGRAESAIPGLGLGLSIARTIVDAHGGSLTADNRPGGGSCFRIRLPLGNPPDFASLELAS